jgi:hypothetical protein
MIRRDLREESTVNVEKERNRETLMLTMSVSGHRYLSSHCADHPGQPGR